MCAKQASRTIALIHPCGFPDFIHGWLANNAFHVWVLHFDNEFAIFSQAFGGQLDDINTRIANLVEPDSAFSFGCFPRPSRRFCRRSSYPVLLLVGQTVEPGLVDNPKRMLKTFAGENIRTDHILEHQNFRRWPICSTVDTSSLQGCIHF